MHRYLYPARKRLEIMSAVFAGGYGIHIWVLSLHGQPLMWADLPNAHALAFGQVMSMAAFVHALGVKINGQWQWSPVMRLVGMAVHVALFAFLAWKGLGTTGGYTYGWIAGLLGMGALSALKDTKRALNGEEHGIRID